MKKVTLFLGLITIGSFAQAQNGLERIVVEKYYVTDAADSTNAADNGAVSALPVGSVTYRVYADMLPGYKFIQMFGDATNDLIFTTTTNFYNDPNNGSTTPQGTSVNNTKKNTTMIDSWLSVGAVASGQLGLLKTEDTDGSIGNNQGILANSNVSAGLPINGTGAQDGMMPGTIVTPNILGVTTQMDLFDQTPGDTFLLNAGAIAALGGIQGLTASNMVLLGQFTTKGIFGFELNIQLGTPTAGGSETYVAHDPTGNQLTDSTLTYHSQSTSGGGGGSGAGLTEQGIAKPSISVYPNPAKDFMYINIANGIDNSSNSYSIKDITGNVLVSNKLENVSGSVAKKVDTSSFPSGVYFVTVSMDGSVSTTKVVKH